MNIKEIGNPVILELIATGFFLLPIVLCYKNKIHFETAEILWYYRLPNIYNKYTKIGNPIILELRIENFINRIKTKRKLPVTRTGTELREPNYNYASITF